MSTATTPETSADVDTRLLADLNPAQREAVQAVQGPVLILAGAGSGKTRALTVRVAYLLATGVARPEQVLALTFTNKAAREMRARIEHLVGRAAARVWMGTFHAVFARMLRIEAEKIGYSRAFTIYDTEDALKVIKELALAEATEALKPDAARQIQGIISGQKNNLTSPGTFAAQASTPIARLAARVYPRYAQVLRARNAMDFDDLLVNTVHLLQQHPEVLHKYQDRFRYILVDEYQDTNRAQYRALALLAAAHHNLCVVGDDAQAIYKWRGADIRNILEFERDFPACRIVRLEQNYRSTRNILASAGTVIKRNRRQLPKTLWTENALGDPVALGQCADEQDEARVCVEVIKDEIGRKKLGFKDCAILYRTNAQSRVIEDTLRHAQIPYQLVGGVAFYQRKEVKDVLAYLRVLVNPHDDESVLRILNVPARGIGETTAAHLRDFAAAAHVPVYDALARAGEIGAVVSRAAEATLAFRRMLDKYRAMRDAVSPAELSSMIVDETGLVRLLKDEGTPEAAERRANILEVLGAIRTFGESNPGARLENFLEEAALSTSMDSTAKGANAVSVMTLHAAKGLEFAVVVIAGCEEGLIPVGFNPEPDDLEEERRLFYVGMTRARQRLVLLTAAVRQLYGERNETLPSRFLADLRGLESVETLPHSAPAAPRTPGVSVAGIPTRAPSVRTGTPRARSAATASNGGFLAGMIVQHEVFGVGRIIQVSGAGDDAHALVEFRTAGRKHLMLRYAKLRRA